MPGLGHFPRTPPAQLPSSSRLAFANSTPVPRCSPCQAGLSRMENSYVRLRALTPNSTFSPTPRHFF